MVIPQHHAGCIIWHSIRKELETIVVRSKTLVEGDGNHGKKADLVGRLSQLSSLTVLGFQNLNSHNFISTLLIAPSQCTPILREVWSKHRIIKPTDRISAIA